MFRLYEGSHWPGASGKQRGSLPSDFLLIGKRAHAGVALEGAALCHFGQKLPLSDGRFPASCHVSTCRTSTQLQSKSIGFNTMLLFQGEPAPPLPPRRALARCPLLRTDRSGVEIRSSSSNAKRGSSSSSTQGGNSQRSDGNTNANTNTNGSSSSNSSSSVMTRKRRLIHEVEAHLAFGITPYWEGGVELGGDTGPEEEGTPRRSRRGAVLLLL